LVAVIGFCLVMLTATCLWREWFSAGRCEVTLVHEGEVATASRPPSSPTSTAPSRLSTARPMVFWSGTRSFRVATSSTKKRHWSKSSGSVFAWSFSANTQNTWTSAGRFATSASLRVAASHGLLGAMPNWTSGAYCRLPGPRPGSGMCCVSRGAKSQTLGSGEGRRYHLARGTAPQCVRSKRFVLRLALPIGGESSLPWKKTADSRLST